MLRFGSQKYHSTRTFSCKKIVKKLFGNIFKTILKVIRWSKLPTFTVIGFSGLCGLVKKMGASLSYGAGCQWFSRVATVSGSSVTPISACASATAARATELSFFYSFWLDWYPLLIHGWSCPHTASLDALAEEALSAPILMVVYSPSGLATKWCARFS